MRPKIKVTISRNPQEVAEAMDLNPCYAIEWELRYSITKKIIAVFQRSDQTVTRVAKKAQTSRARITRILKGDSHGISLDVLLRVLAAVGQSITISYKKAA